MNIILLGAPGAGKGTQAQKISKKYGIPHLSTGDMLRAAVISGSQAGKAIANRIDKGYFVSDEMIIGLIETRILESDCENGFILDGFPRNIAQAQHLDRLFRKTSLKVDYVFYFHISKPDIIDRISGRLTASKSGCSYHNKYHPPKVTGICDVSGEELITRKDDNEAAISTRVDTYNQETAPIISYYAMLNSFYRINGAQPIGVIFKKIASIIK